MLARLLQPSLERQRRALLSKRPAEPLLHYLQTPFPHPDTPSRELGFLAVDLETSGLKPQRDHLLSIGFVPVDGEAIALAGATLLLVQSEGDVSQSATVHGLTDDALLTGLEPEVALSRLLEALAGRVMLAHHAVIETRFLSQLSQKLWGAPLLCPVVDTLKLQARLVARTTGTPKDGELRLGAARARFGLPRYPAHDALSDALACAELFLAQRAEFGETRLKALQRANASPFGPL